MFKYQVTYICDNNLSCNIEHYELESSKKLSLDNPQDKDFILRDLQSYYPKHNIRIQRIKELGKPLCLNQQFSGV